MVIKFICDCCGNGAELGGRGITLTCACDFGSDLCGYCHKCMAHCFCEPEELSKSTLKTQFCAFSEVLNYGV